jgi:hypothetical protein
MTPATNHFKSLFASLILALPLAYAPAALAADQFLSCKLASVAAFGGRVHVQCVIPANHEEAEKFGSIRFFAIATNVSAQQDAYIDHVLAIANTAIATGHTVQVMFDFNDHSGAAFGCLDSDCRVLHAIQAFRN